MARGNPDFFGQAISATVGAYNYSDISYDLDALFNPVVVLNINSKCIIKRLHFSVLGDVYPLILNLVTVIDGSVTIQNTVRIPYQRVVQYNPGMIFVELSRKDVFKECVMGIISDLPIESSLITTATIVNIGVSPTAHVRVNCVRQEII
jgi:hypothetical protein